LVRDMVRSSDGKPQIEMSEEALFYMDKLRTFMFDWVYYSPKVRRASDLKNVQAVIKTLYNYYLTRPEELPEEIQHIIAGCENEEVVKDYIAGMTDRFALNRYEYLCKKEPGLKMK
ncbi:MAG: deoxyguanosinetriphosphate triphosphohydrolase, partial [Anaerovoracaceae bacterium]